jgi:hypothetical protein
MNTLPDHCRMPEDQPAPQPGCRSAAAATLNRHCFCVSMDGAALRDALESELHEPGLFALIEERCPYVFAARPVFISADHARQIRELVRAVETVAALPAYQAEVLAAAPDIAQRDPGGARSVFFGYDFHVDEHGIGLVEINTNAGGAMLNSALAKAQRACCEPVEKLLPDMDGNEWEGAIAAMFQNEWLLAGRNSPLRTVAIVDDDPQNQYLYPEFLLFQRLFARYGIKAVIADPRELEFRAGALWHGGTAIDLVYNRLTDFMLDAPSSAALREAYLTQAVVLTPHPQAHALYANKRNLALLTDESRLVRLGVPPAVRASLLAAIPRTEIVDPADAERLWADRKQLFFKPASGYGSRAAYRGDKLTRRVWDEILAGDYVAQKIILPAERRTEPDQDKPMKFDVRAYVYDGQVQWLAARLYQGQTTNFRTPGGGFAPVYPLE